MGSSCSSSNGCTECRSTFGSVTRTGNCDQGPAPAAPRVPTKTGTFATLDRDRDTFLSYGDTNGKNSAHALQFVYFLSVLLQAVDLDSDDKISQKEYGKFYQNVGKSTERTRAIFKNWDENNDQRVSLKELISYKASQGEGQADKLQNAIKKLGRSANNDTSLDDNEIKDIMELYGP